MTLGRHAVATDPGRKRRHNEDAYVVEPPLFAVADGMGGAQAGEVASRLAAGALREGGGRLEDLIQEANRRVHQRSIEDPGAAGMGTTMTVAVVEDGTVRFGHVGDSRAYLIREGRLEQLTDDHSLVGELVRSGQLAREDADSHPQRSVITRAVGTDPDVDIDTFTVDVHDGDLFLLCSDGLTDMVADTKIERLVDEKRSDLEGLVKALVRAANKGGGDDNITVIAFDIAPAGDAADDEATVVLGSGAADLDEEDTLTEEDGVPAIKAVDTMVVSADELAAAYEAEQEAQPSEPKRRRRSDAPLLLIVLLAFAVLVLLAVWGLYR
jgi:protein phosphatase